MAKTRLQMTDLERAEVDRDEARQEALSLRAALADLAAKADEFSDATRAWFESKRPSPRLGIPIPGKRETEKVQTAWEEMDKSTARARKVMKERI